jgi:Na+/melibiose symporter-like transporter
MSTGLPAATSDVRLSMKEKLAFSVGELYGSGATSLVASVYLVFWYSTD